tara:strand:- start:349 stop:1329 length:981 start_codon:yes stop_codon:yes gene_type:complete
MAGMRHKFVPVAETLRKEKEELTRKKLLSFPGDLAVHAMLIDFKEYQWSGSSVKEETTGSLALPPPREFREDYRVNWANQELGPILGQSVEEVMNVINKWDDNLTFGENVSAAATNLTSGMGTNVSPGTWAQAGAKASGSGAAGLLAKSNALRAVGIAGAASALGGDSIESAISAGSGVAVNPVEAAIFKGVPLRTHNFSWRLSPRNQKEEGFLRQIIHMIKTKMHPTYEGFGKGGNFGFKYPDVAHITYEGSMMENPPRFKPAVIQDFKVDYSEGGSPAFYKKTGNPVTYNLSMQLMEIDILTREDWDKEKPSAATTGGPGTGFA